MDGSVMEGVGDRTGGRRRAVSFRQSARKERYGGDERQRGATTAAAAAFGPERAVQVLRESGGVNADPKTIEKMREHFNMRKQVLEANKRDRCLNGDDVYSAYQDYEAMSWLADDNPDRKQEHEFVYLFISSAMCDPFAYPNAGSFKISLASEIDNVIKAELVQASIPLVDPTINSDNNILRYSFTPFTGAAVREVKIPVGSYLGTRLAPEITRQMNQDLFAADILANTYLIDDETGQVNDAGTGVPPVGVDQFRCSWDQSRQRITIQLVDDDLLPENGTEFAIHVQPRPAVAEQVPFRFMYDDIYDVIGMNRILFEDDAAALSQYDAASNTFYLTNLGNSARFNGLFGVAASVDARWRYSVHSNQAADLRGNIAVVLDIDPLNDNDIARVSDSAGTGALTLSDFFGFILLRDPASVTDRMAEINNNSFPIRKYYREGRSRVSHLSVNMLRPDGTVFNFGGVDFYLTLRLTVTRTQPAKPMFARG